MSTSLKQSRFRVEAMDCPSEEQLIRTAFAGNHAVQTLEFDLPARELRVWHTSEVSQVHRELDRLKLGATLLDTEMSGTPAPLATSPQAQAKVLRLLLVINGLMFFVEGAAGLLWESTGLLSDSLDMLADAMVYGVALWSVHNAAAGQERAARLAGWIEMALALGVLAEVARTAIVGSTPAGLVMMATSTLALIANVTCLLALAKHRSGGVHMRASWIFSTNDVIANLGVIMAGALVLWTSSPLPDLIVGAIIGLIVLRGALRILRLSSDASESGDSATPSR